MNAKLHIPPSGRYRILKRNATVQDVAQLMVEVIQALSIDPFVLLELEALVMDSNNNLLQRLANRAYNAAYFYPDKHGIQDLRTPQALVRDGKANCVDYSIFIASIANAAGLPVVLRIAQLPGQDNFGHVYPIVYGVPMDVVIGQREDGTEYLHRNAYNLPKIGVELPYIKKLDFYV